MIDWQVQVGGAFPPGWDQHRDGCWFPDFDHQENLLPHFSVRKAPLDPYGDTEYVEADVRRLRAQLQELRGVVESKPETWSVSGSSSGQKGTLRLSRKETLAVIDKTLAMIEFALAPGGTLIFRGD